MQQSPTTDAGRPDAAPPGSVRPQPATGTGTSAAIVTYNPELTLLKTVIAAVVPQVDAVLVIDNSEDPALMRATEALCGSTGVVHEWMGVNLGIGEAHNVAIRWSIERGDRFLVLLDQDSTPAHDMVAALRTVLTRRQDAGERVAAAGPCYGYEPGVVDSFFLQFRFPLHRRFYADTLPAGTVIRTDCLISSGTLFSTSALAEVGEMRGDFFIDHVDTEWFLRASADGFHAYGVRDAVMTHALGDGTLKLWFGHWRNYPLHVPERCYYTFRNSLKLYREPHANAAWMLFDLYRLFAMFVISVTRAPNRVANLRNILRGLRDGLRLRGDPRPLQRPASDHDRSHG